MGSNSKIQAPDRRLDSWKEISAFFKCDERTLRRWEKERGLPIHRLPGGAGGKVFAYESELSQWLGAPQTVETDTPPPPLQIGLVQPELVQPELVRPKLVQPASKRISLPLSGGWAVALALGSVLGLAVLSLSLLYRSPTADSIAVLPFTNTSGDPQADYLGDGITESLIGNLAHVPQLKVKSRNSVFHYKGHDVDLQKVGKDLDVSLVVSGRVVSQGENIEISAELTDVRENTEIWLQQYKGKGADILSLQQRIAGDIAEKLRSKLSPSEKQQVTRQGTENPEAYELYLKGRYAWSKRTAPDIDTAISYFNQAIAKDPNYALAYSALADAYSVMVIFRGNPSENFPKSNAAARRALELDATLSHPHAVLGVNETQYDWDFAGGEAEFKKALELDPNDATAHQWYAESLDRIGGRQREALAEINRAHQLDPLSGVITRVVGGILITAGQYDQGIGVCQKLANDDPTFAIAHDCLAYAYWAKRMYPQVVQEWKTYGQLSGNSEESGFANTLDHGFRNGGWKGALTESIEFRQKQVLRGHCSPVEIAFYYSDLGDKDRAFEWLDTAYQKHDWMLIGLKTYFQLDPLRSDPRFAELATKVGLPN